MEQRQGGRMQKLGRILQRVGIDAAALCSAHPPSPHTSPLYYRDILQDSAPCTPSRTRLLLLRLGGMGWTSEARPVGLPKAYFDDEDDSGGSGFSPLSLWRSLSGDMELMRSGEEERLPSSRLRTRSCGVRWRKVGVR